MPVIYIYEAMQYLGAINIGPVNSWATDIAVNPELGIIYVVGLDVDNISRILTFSTETYEYLGMWPDELIQGAIRLAYSPETNLLAVAATNVVYLFDATEQTYLCALDITNESKTAAGKVGNMEISTLGVGWIAFTQQGDLLAYHYFHNQAPSYLDIFTYNLGDSAQFIKSAAKR